MQAACRNSEGPLERPGQIGSKVFCKKNLRQTRQSPGGTLGGPQGMPDAVESSNLMQEPGKL